MRYPKCEGWVEEEEHTKDEKSDGLVDHRKSSFQTFPGGEGHSIIATETSNERLDMVQ